jgi:hypothetical protein
MPGRRDLGSAGAPLLRYAVCDGVKRASGLGLCVVPVAVLDRGAGGPAHQFRKVRVEYGTRAGVWQRDTLPYEGRHGTAAGRSRMAGSGLWILI